MVHEGEASGFRIPSNGTPNDLQLTSRSIAIVYLLAMVCKFDAEVIIELTLVHLPSLDGVDEAIEETT